MLTYNDLHPYQNGAIDDIYGKDQSILRIPMGGGKTVIGGTVAVEMLQEGIVNRWLILAPKRVCQLVWPQEFLKWQHLAGTTIALAVGTAEERMAALTSTASVVIMNYENLDWMIDTYGGVMDFDGVIYDELTRLKNPQGKRHKKLKKHLEQFTIRIGMTGTLSSNGIKDVYGQVYCVDAGKRLGRSFSRFRQQYFDKVGPMQWQWEPRKDAIERITTEISDITVQIDDSVYVDQLPPLHINRIPVNLGKDYDRYLEMEKEYITIVEDEDVMAANAGVALSKCQQIADGFLYRGNGSSWIHDRKLDALEELIDSMDGRPLLVAYKFTRELEAMRGRWDYPYIGGGVTGPQAQYAVDKWNAGDLPILFGHPASFGHGLNLQHGGNTVCWYGHTWSWEEHTQTIARLRRQGQEEDQVWSHYIVAEGTVDEQIIQSVSDKADVDKAVVAGIRARQQSGGMG